MNGPLKGQDHPGKESGQDENKERSDPDLVHVVERLLDVCRFSKDARNGDGAETGEFLDREDIAFEAVFYARHSWSILGSWPEGCVLYWVLRGPASAL